MLINLMENIEFDDLFSDIPINSECNAVSGGSHQIETSDVEFDLFSDLEISDNSENSPSFINLENEVNKTYGNVIIQEDNNRDNININGDNIVYRVPGVEYGDIDSYTELTDIFMKFRSEIVGGK